MKFSVRFLICAKPSKSDCRSRKETFSNPIDYFITSSLGLSCSGCQESCNIVATQSSNTDKKQDDVWFLFLNPNATVENFELRFAHHIIFMCKGITFSTSSFLPSPHNLVCYQRTKECLWQEPGQKRVIVNKMRLFLPSKNTSRADEA